MMQLVMEVNYNYLVFSFLNNNHLVKFIYPQILIENNN